MVQAHSGYVTDSSPSGVRTAKDFSEALTALRGRAALTVREVAAVAGQPSATVGGYFSGRHLPPVARPEALTSILAALGVTDPAEVEEWLEALRRVRRRPRRDEIRNPYPGLVSFDGNLAPFYFGREDLTDSIVRQLSGSQAGLFLVLGASGSGKSSLLRAGVVPRLVGTEGGARRVTVFTPGNNPLSAWALATTSALEGFGSGPEVTVIDQFEEVFTLAPAEARREFLEALTRSAGSDGASPGGPVLVALRADFFGEAAAEPLLLPALEHHQVIVGPLSDEQLEAAIVEPARRAGSDIEPALVQLLLHDARATRRPRAPEARNAGVLPRLAHALHATWDAADGKPLTVAAYQQTGGVRGGVLKTAEEAWSRLDADEQEAMQALFVRLTAFDMRSTGRPVPLDDLDLSDRTAPLATAIDAFVDARLLTIDASSVRVAHEALLAEWSRTSEWLASREQELATRRAISAGAREWASAQDEALLLRGSRLASARELTTTSGSVGLSPAELRYVEASVALSESELRRERFRSRRLRLLVAAVSVLTLLAGSFAGFFARSTATARTERDQALSRQIATEAERIAPQDVALAAELALVAYRTSPTLEARSALLNATGRAGVSRLGGPEGLVRTAVAPDGKLLATAHADGTLQTWPRDPLTGRLGVKTVTRVSPAGSTLFALAFSPSGDVLAVGGATDNVTLLDVTSSHPRPVGAGLTAKGGVYALAFSDTGTTLAAGRISGDVALWQLSPDGDANPTPLPDLPTGAPVQTVRFGPAGLLAAGGNDATLHLFRADKGYTSAGSLSLGEPSNTLFSLAFDNTGTTLAVGSRDRYVRLIDVTNPDRPTDRGRPIGGFGSWVNAVAYSHDASLIAAGSSDGTLRVFRVADRAVLATLPAPSPVTDVTFLPDGGWVLFGALDGVSRLWQIGGPGTPPGADSIAQVAYSRSGNQLASATYSAEGALRVADVSDWRRPRLTSEILTKAGPERLNGAAALSPDGRTVAVGSSAGHVQIWDIGTAGTAVPGVVLTEPTALVEYVAFSADGKLLAAGDDANLVNLWDMSDASSPRHLTTLEGATALLLSVTISPDSRLVAAASADKTVRVWDITDPSKPSAATTLMGFDNYAYSVAFSPDSRLLATGSSDRTVRLWRTRPGAPITQVGPVLSGPTSDVLAVALDRHGTRLAAATRGGSVWEWDVSDPEQPVHLTTMDPRVGHLNTIAYSPTRDLIAAAGDGRTVVQFLYDTGSAAEFVCRNVVDPISRSEWIAHVPGIRYRPPC